jgi:hypothetical protein
LDYLNPSDFVTRNPPAIQSIERHCYGTVHFCADLFFLCPFLVSENAPGKLDFLRCFRFRDIVTQDIVTQEEEGEGEEIKPSKRQWT